MLVTIIMCCFLGASVYSQQHSIDNEAADVLSSTNDINPDGSYKYSFKTSNEITQEETGTVQHGDEVDYLAIQGSYSYIGPDNLKYTVRYTADKDGFRPKIHIEPASTSSDLPTLTIPEYVPKLSLEVIGSLVGRKK